MSTRMPVPEIPEALLKYLQSIFPERCPDSPETDTAQSIWFYAGKRYLVNWLTEAYRKQTDSKPKPA